MKESFEQRVLMSTLCERVFGELPSGDESPLQPHRICSWVRLKFSFCYAKWQEEGEHCFAAGNVGAAASASSIPANGPAASAPISACASQAGLKVSAPPAAAPKLLRGKIKYKITYIIYYSNSIKSYKSNIMVL